MASKVTFPGHYNYLTLNSSWKLWKLAAKFRVWPASASGGYHRDKDHCRSRRCMQVSGLEDHERATKQVDTLKAQPALSEDLKSIVCMSMNRSPKWRTARCTAHLWIRVQHANANIAGQPPGVPASRRHRNEGRSCARATARKV